MITVPQGTNISQRMRYLIEFFNKLEQDLEYPNCEGYADARRCIEAAELQLVASQFIPPNRIKP